MTEPAKTAADPSPESATGYRIAMLTAVAAGAFSLVVCGLLARDYGRRLAKDPLDSAEFKAMKVKLTQNPKEETLKERIREQDEKLRHEYFRQRAFAGVGAGLLLGGVLVTLIAIRVAGTLRRKIPAPVPQAMPYDPEIRMTRIARWSVAAVAGVLVCLAVLLIATLPTPLARSEGELAAMLQPLPSATGDLSTHSDQAPADKQPVAPVSETPGAATGSLPTRADPAPAGKQSAAPTPAAAGVLAGDDPSYPTDDEILKNWPRFRGPVGSGITAETGLPTSWNAATGKSILWKTPVPTQGHNSPIIWNDRIFISGADQKTRKVFCFDAVGGKLLWQSDVPVTPQTPATPPKIQEDTGYAASTMATDGRRAFAIFANGDVTAMDFNGKPVWTRSLGSPKNSYGHASSLATYKNLLLIQFDQGEEKGQSSLSKLLALEARSGKVVWETPRAVPNSWPTPVVIRHAGRDQLLASGDPWVISYNPADGKELWRFKCLRGDVGPSPVFAGGAVYAVSQDPCLTAIKADGQGDVTKSHKLWIGDDGLPDTCTPVATEEFVFLLSGVLTCYDAKSGRKLWEKDFDGQFKASPSMAGKYLYLLNDEGKAWVVEPNRTDAKPIGTASVSEPCTASPAFHNGRIYLRGGKSLFCIGEEGTKAQRHKGTK